MPIEALRTHERRISHLIQQFETLQESAEDKGTWENLSMDRQMEITERYRFAKRSFEQFDAMIARLASPRKLDIEEDVTNMLNLDSL